MTPFSLKIVTPDGLKFDGQAEELIVRTTSGDMGILAGHIDITTALGSGEARVVIDGTTRAAECKNGLLSVQNGEVTLLPAAFQWKN